MMAGNISETDSKKVDITSTKVISGPAPTNGGNITININMMDSSLRRSSSSSTGGGAAATDYNPPRSLLLYFLFVLVFVFTLIQQSNTIFDAATHSHEVRSDHPSFTAPDIPASERAIKNNKAIKTKRGLQHNQQKQKQNQQQKSEVVNQQKTTKRDNTVQTKKKNSPKAGIEQESSKQTPTRKKREKRETTVIKNTPEETPPAVVKESVAEAEEAAETVQPWDSNHGDVVELPESQPVVASEADEPTLQQRSENSGVVEEDIKEVKSSPEEEEVPPTTRKGRRGGRKDKSKETETNSKYIKSPTTTTTTTTSYSQHVDEKSLDSMLDKIIAKWEIPDATGNAKTLLRLIWHKDNSYDPQKDLIVFTHPLKSGGTSVSNILDTLGDAVPGSHESGHFNFKGFQSWNAMEKLQSKKDGTIDHWADSPTRQNMKSLYSHSGYRKYREGRTGGGGPGGGLVSLLATNFPTRRVRHIMMVREPLAFAASNYNEWYCNFAKLNKKAKEFKIAPLPEDAEYVGCNGFTLEMLAKVRQARNAKECDGFTPENATAYHQDIRRRCRAARKNNWENQPECSNIDVFLDSQSYNQHFHNHGAYARCTVPVSNTTTETDTTPTTTTADYVEGAIEYLGGLDAPVVNGIANGDMMWHGVTERMKDSMCLLHHELKLPWQSTPTRRIQKCRPTNYWTEDHRAKFYAKEPMMLAVHKAANAVLDVQLAKMRLEVTQLQHVLGPSANLTYVGEGCLEGDDYLELPTMTTDIDNSEQAEPTQAVEEGDDSNTDAEVEEEEAKQVVVEEVADSPTTETKKTRRGRKKRQQQEMDQQDSNNDNSPTAAGRSASSQVNSQALDSMLDNIIAKWNIQDATNARTLLRKIWYKDNAYDKERDLIVFTHPLKTGGTSVSNLLDSMGNVVPGSHESGHFGNDRFNTWDKMDRATSQREGIDWADSPRRRNMRSLYSHAGYRRYGQRIGGANSTGGLVNLVHESFPNRRVRHIMMVREPLAFVASNFNEWKCKLVKMSKWAREFKIPPLAEDSGYNGCNGYTVEMLAQARVAKFQKDCKGYTPATAKSFEKDLRKKCQAAAANNGDPWPECSSIDKFLNSPSYTQHFRNSGSYGRCTVPIAHSRTAADYVEGAIEYLGGLDAPMVNGYANGDMMWHGITERMKESMCLLHYELKLPWQSTPTRRIQQCRPTSYWSEDNRAKFYGKEPMMLAVHRAANAVLDVQLAKMRVEVAYLQKAAGANLTYVGEGCLEGDDHLELIKMIA